MSKPISTKNQILAELLEEEGRRRYRQPISHRNDTDVAVETESGVTPHPGHPELAMAGREPTSWQMFEDQSEALNAAVAALKDLRNLITGQPSTAFMA